MKVSMIVAVAENRAIGKNNQLLWHLPTDLKHFKNRTLGHPMLMGRNTYESIGKPLPGRTSIIITRQKDYHPAGCMVTHSIQEAIEEAKKIEPNEIFVIGGAQIYEHALSLTDKIYYTQVHHSFNGDTFFPALNPTEWHETRREKFPADEKHAYAYDFVEFERIP